MTITQHFRTPRRARRYGLPAVLLTAITVAATALVAQGAHGAPVAPTSSNRQSTTHLRSAAAPAVNVALTGATASATSAAATQPASAVIDGDAGTAWCATGWQGTVTVDLGSVRRVKGLGFTVPSSASTVTATVALARMPAKWRPVNAARSVALSPGQPSYVPLPAHSTARLARVTLSTGDGTPACLGEFRVFGRAANAPTMLGADLSFSDQETAAGTRFTDAGRAASPVQILRDHGGNYVRMRLWVNPPAGYSDLAADLALARQVRAAGMRIYLDIHYSDFWADPQHQDTPKDWQGLNLPALAGKVRNYTKSVMTAFARQHTPVSMVSIGNEIRNGMLWPTGQIDWTTDTGWGNLATLLKAGVAGARAANPRGNPLRVMLHYDQGGDNTTSYHFFHELSVRGVPFDVIGLSYYPFWHGTLSDLRNNVDKLAVQFGKDIVIAETQYAWTLANGDTEGNFVWQPSQVSAGYPASPGGQLSFVNDVLSILAAAPGGHGAGLFYWEPEWVPGVGWQSGAGAPNDNLTLFDFQGRALPSIGMLENPVRVCQRNNRYAVPCTVD